MVSYTYDKEKLSISSSKHKKHLASLAIDLQYIYINQNERGSEIGITITIKK